MMTSLARLSGFVAAVLSLAVPAVGLAGPPVEPVVNQRPIEEFVAAQGTFCVVMGSNPACVLFEPPVGNILGWISIQDGVRYFAKIDFAGLADRYLGGVLGTTFEGSITERLMPDGRAEVSVRLHTRNALAWVSGRTPTPTGSWGPAFPLLGHPAQQVEAGADPALADCEFRFVFVNPAMGAPMPDLTQFSFDPAYVGQRLFESISAQARGLTPDHAPAALVLHMTGLMETYQQILERRVERYGEDWVAPTTHGIWTDAGWPGGVLEIKPVGAGN